MPDISNERLAAMLNGIANNVETDFSPSKYHAEKRALIIRKAAKRIIELSEEKKECHSQA